MPQGQVDRYLATMSGGNHPRSDTNDNSVGSLDEDSDDWGGRSVNSRDAPHPLLAHPGVRGSPKSSQGRKYTQLQHGGSLHASSPLKRGRSATLLNNGVFGGGHVVGAMIPEQEDYHLPDPSHHSNGGASGAFAHQQSGSSHHGGGGGPGRPLTSPAVPRQGSIRMSSLASRPTLTRGGTRDSFNLTLKSGIGAGGMSNGAHRGAIQSLGKQLSAALLSRQGTGTRGGTGGGGGGGNGRDSRSGSRDGSSGMTEYEMNYCVNVDAGHKWTASVNGDTSLFVYPSLNVGSMRQPKETWRLEDRPQAERPKTSGGGEASIAASGASKPREAGEMPHKPNPILAKSMKEGEDYLRAQMKAVSMDRASSPSKGAESMGGGKIFSLVRSMTVSQKASYSVVSAEEGPEVSEVPSNSASPEESNKALTELATPSIAGDAKRGVQIQLPDGASPKPSAEAGAKTASTTAPSPKTAAKTIKRKQRQTFAIKQSVGNATDPSLAGGAPSSSANPIAAINAAASEAAEAASISLRSSMVAFAGSGIAGRAKSASESPSRGGTGSVALEGAIEYKSLLKRGSKFFRSVAKVEKNPAIIRNNAEIALLRDAEKSIPSELRAEKVAIMNYMLLNMRRTFEVEKNDRQKSFLQRKLHGSEGVTSGSRDERGSHGSSSFAGDDEEDLDSESKTSLSPTLTVRGPSWNLWHEGDEFVGLGEAGHMGEFEKGHVPIEDEGLDGVGEYIGEKARQSFFDRYQRIASNRFTLDIDLKTAVVHDSQPAASFSESESLSRTTSPDLSEGHGHVRSRKSPLPFSASPGTSPKVSPDKKYDGMFSNPIDKYLNTCIQGDILPEPTIIKKSYIRQRELEKEMAGTWKPGLNLSGNAMIGFGTPLLYTPAKGSVQGSIPSKQRIFAKHQNEVLNFSDYGMGDERAIALAEAFVAMNFIKALSFGNNRLTYRSLNVILAALRIDTLVEIDLSRNVVNVEAATAIAKFASSSDSLRYLKLDHCEIGDLEVKALLSGLGREPVEKVDKGKRNGVTKLGLSGNNIGSKGGEYLASLIATKLCTFHTLDLSYNIIQGEGGVKLGNALATNTSITVLNLAMNRFVDAGTKAVAASFLKNVTLRELNLEHNSVTTEACFVIASNLRKNISLKTLTLIGNPLGEQGGRCLVRSIIEGMVCIVIMTGCTFCPSDTLRYDHSNPGQFYDLDLDNPFQFSILHELCRVATTKPNCSFASAKHFNERNAKGGWSAKSSAVQIDAHNPSTVPSTGRVTFTFKYTKSVPSMTDCISEKGLKLWIDIIAGAKTEDDRKNWLKLVMQDYYVTTTQVERVLYELDNRKTDHTKLDRKEVLLRVWTRILDSDRKFKFMASQLNSDGCKELAKSVGFTRFKLNFLNPTGHWNLDLANDSHQEVWQMISALELNERKISKESGKGDTSQKGNWTNFRNEKLDSIKFEINSQSVEGLSSGTLEFDYVSTTRPPLTATSLSNSDFLAWMKTLGISDSMSEKPGGIIFQIQLTHAVCEHYFTTAQAMALINDVQGGKDQADAAVALFARIIDVENFDIILKSSTIPPKWRQNIIDRLGWLNVGNPLKPEHNFELNLLSLDNRYMLKFLMTLGSNEPGVHIRDQKKTDIPMQEIYGNGSIMNTPSDKTVRLEYSEVKGLELPNFDERKRNLDKFLISRKPFRAEIFVVAKQFDELHAAGKITAGPISRQYEQYMREKIKAKANWKMGHKKMGGVIGILQRKTERAQARQERRLTELAKAEQHAEETGVPVQPVILESSSSEDESDSGSSADER